MTNSKKVVATMTKPLKTFVRYEGTLSNGIVVQAEGYILSARERRVGTRIDYVVHVGRDRFAMKSFVEQIHHQVVWGIDDMLTQELSEYIDKYTEKHGEEAGGELVNMLDRICARFHFTDMNNTKDRLKII